MRYADFKRNACNPAVYIFPMVSIILILIMRGGRKFISDVDHNIALTVKKLYDENELYLPHILEFCNEYFAALVVVPIILLGIHALLLSVSVLGISLKGVGLYTAYETVAIVCFILFNICLNLILKKAINRARPSETLGLAQDFDICQIEFVGFLFSNPVKSTCDEGFYSCPSGHTNCIASFMAGSCFMQAYFTKHLKFVVPQKSKRTVWLRLSNAALICLIAVLTVILIGSVAVARILGFKHYFGDVTLAAVQVWMFGLFWPLLEPDAAWLRQVTCENPESKTDIESTGTLT